MTILTLGLNHQTAPLSLREQVAFPAEKISQALADLRMRLGGLVQEGAILSTCNRTELYVAGSQTSLKSYKEPLAAWLCEQHQVAPNELNDHLYLRGEDEAVRHAFRVASGLDSMVLGEPQILGQMKEAARNAQSAQAIGVNLHQLFQRSFAVAKEVRTSTAIGEQSVSLAAASVRLAQRVFGQLNSSKILFIGAGEMIDLCATHFAGQNPAQMVIANRTLERGQKLAQRLQAHTLALSEVPQHLEKFDIVVSCTASTLPIIGLGLVERALKARRRRPIVMIDLAVPRDIEAEVANLSDVYLYTVDDLGRLIQSNREARQAAVSQAEAIIETQVQSFMGWIANRQHVPLIQQFQSRADQLTQLELEKAQRLVAQGTDPQQALEQLAYALKAKFTHGPTQLLREQGAAVAPLIEQLLPQPIVQTPAQPEKKKNE